MTSPMQRVSSLVSKDIGSYLTNVQTWKGVIFNVKDYGAKGNGTTNDTAAIQAACDAAALVNGVVVFPDNHTYLINSKITAKGSFSMLSMGKATIKLGSTVDNMFQSAYKFIVDNLIIDGNNKTTNAIFYTTVTLPEYYRCEIKNSGPASTGIMNADNSSGKCIIEKCDIHDCYRGVTIYGDYANSNSIVFTSNMRIYNITGDITYYFQGHLGGVDVNGGEYAGTNSAPNCYLCNNVNIIGGYYHDSLRGPTIGKSTKYFTISNTICRNISVYGISLDTKIDNTPTYDFGKGEVTGNVIESCAVAMRIQANNVTIRGNVSIDHTGSDAAFIIQNSTPVFIGGNTVTGGNGKGFRSAASRVIVTNPNMSDSTTMDVTYGSDSTPIEFGKVCSFSGTGEKKIPTDAETIYCDTSAGSYNIRLTSGSFIKMLGKKLTIIKTSSDANSVFLAVASGTTINGSTSAVTFSGQRNLIMLDCNGSDWNVIYKNF